MKEHSFNLAEIVCPRAGSPKFGLIACSIPDGMSGQGGGLATIRCGLEAIPPEGILIAGTWTEHSNRDNHNPFVIHVDDDGTHRVLDPQEAWEYIPDKKCCLRAKSWNKYSVAPTDLGYFECFYRDNFTVLDHFSLLARMANAADTVPSGPFAPGNQELVLTIKALLIQSIQTQAERDKARGETKKHEKQLLEVAAWLQSLLHPGRVGPLGALVKSKSPEVACLAKQMAGHLIRALRATGELTAQVNISQVARAPIHLDDDNLPTTCYLLNHYCLDRVGTCT